MKSLRVVVLAVVVALTGCGDGGPRSPDVVAVAAGMQFPSEAAAQILAPEVQLPAEPEIVEALANLWIDYFLLARTAAADSTLSNLDVSLLVDQQVEQELVVQLRAQVIQVDTAISFEALQARFEEELPGGRVRAKHILIGFPTGATPAQEDSVRALVASLRSRLLEGEDFGALAQEFSQDAVSGANGGDLGTFARGDMVPPFEEAAFALDVGELSDPVQTSYGLHLIRVEERVIPPLEDSAPQFRSQLQNQMLMEAESMYVANLVETSQLTVEEESYESVKELASNPQMTLTGRASDKPLARYSGGSLTLGELQEWMQVANVQVLQQIKESPDDQLEVLLHNLARSEILVTEARNEGIEVSVERQDSIADEVRTSVANIAGQMGFFQLTPLEGESMDAAADRMVREILVGVVNRTWEAYPLGTVGFAMRRQFSGQISPLGLEKAAERILELRTLVPTPTPALVPPPVQAPDTTTPDSAGSQG